MNNDQTIKQLGLYVKDDQSMEDFTKRVASYNTKNKGSEVLLNILPYQEGDEQIKEPHYKLQLTFPNKGVQQHFWAN